MLLRMFVYACTVPKDSPFQLSGSNCRTRTYSYVLYQKILRSKSSFEFHECRTSHSTFQYGAVLQYSPLRTMCRTYFKDERSWRNPNVAIIFAVRQSTLSHRSWASKACKHNVLRNDSSYCKTVGPLVFDI